MATLVWTEQFSVGVEEIDNQHKILIDLIDRLYQAAVKRQDKELTAEVLATLIDYTKTHFALEEDLLKLSGYPAFAVHQQEHVRFVQKIADLSSKFQVENRSVTLELIKFLNNWLSGHILNTDKAYAPHLAKSSATRNWAKGANADSQRALGARPWWKFWGS